MPATETKSALYLTIKSLNPDASLLARKGSLDEVAINSLGYPPCGPSKNQRIKTSKFTQIQVVQSYLAGKLSSAQQLARWLKMKALVPGSQHPTKQAACFFFGRDSHNQILAVSPLRLKNPKGLL